MKVQRVCKICGRTFFAIKTTQFFCSRKCFKKDYYIKVKINKQKQSRIFPEKKCPYCEETSKLTFDPVSKPELFQEWACPKCGVPNRLIWKYNGVQSSKAAIKSIIEDNKILPQEQQYQTYNIPVVRPEECDSNPVIILSCEKTSILEIQKLDRKKITFK